jgi:demethylmenaquinone methyltransferase / 2-methoxy-6-polyprenyl-1,4-benzoquinol methylase
MAQEQQQKIRVKKNKKSKTQDLYDRIADVQNLAMKINGYRESVAKYLHSLDLDIKPDSLVLDAGSGTGLVTLALHSAGYHPKKTFALDISYNSLTVASEQFREDKKVTDEDVEAVQGNLLALPFADESFDVVLTCGALEYVPLDAGLQELARVLKKDGTLVLIPVRPSLVSSFLEVLYNFKTHSLEEVRKTSRRYFQIIGNYKFPITEPIGWSKTLFLLQKK